jgi:ATP-dependent Clp protease adapter protein ClpS
MLALDFLVCVSLAGSVVLARQRLVRRQAGGDRLWLAFQVAAYDAKRRGHAEWDEEHFVHALIHDAECTAGVLPAEQIEGWQEAMSERLARRPAEAAPGDWSKPSPTVVELMGRAASEREPRARKMLQHLLRSPAFQELAVAVAAKPSRSSGTADAGYRGEVGEPRDWQIRCWNDPHTTTDQVVALLEGVFDLRATTALFHMFETHRFDSSVLGPYSQREASALVAKAAAWEASEGVALHLTVEPRGTTPSATQAWRTLREASRLSAARKARRGEATGEESERKKGP